jgi:hypothetical protein
MNQFNSPDIQAIFIKKHTFEEEYQDFLKIYQQTINPVELHDPHQ